MEHINLQPDSVQTLLCSHDYEQQIQSHLLLYERTAKASPHSDLTAQPPPVEGWGVAFMWPQNFRARLIFHSKLQNSWCCSHPEHSHHLWHSSRNMPWQGKEDSLPCLFMNICERSTASKRADNTTFKLGRQIALIPRNKKNNKALKIHTSTTLLPALFVCHYFPPHRLSGTQHLPYYKPDTAYKWLQRHPHCASTEWTWVTNLQQLSCSQKEGTKTKLINFGN